jgi:hypothetical protein
MVKIGYHRALNPLTFLRKSLKVWLCCCYVQIVWGAPYLMQPPSTYSRDSVQTCFMLWCMYTFHVGSVGPVGFRGDILHTYHMAETLVTISRIAPQKIALWIICIVQPHRQNVVSNICMLIFKTTVNKFCVSRVSANHLCRQTMTHSEIICS